MLETNSKSKIEENILPKTGWRNLQEFKFILPYDYDISDNGVSKVTFFLKPKIESITPKPLLITGQAINTDEKIIKLDLAFKRNDLWEKIQVEREILSDSRQIITLSNNGVPVHTGNAKKLVEYLHAFENVNLPYLPTIYLTYTNGWKEFNKKRIFGLGEKIIGLDDNTAKISFFPEPGFERFTRALNPCGSMEEWKSVIKPALTFHRAAFALYASLSAPLLSIVNAPNFIVHYWGDSSLGKTTALEIAASVWGNPAKESGGLVTSWNNTQVFIERVASFFNDLPVCLDDSHTTNDQVVSKTLYMVANGVGRGRGTKIGGILAPASWYTVCFSTGEKRATETTPYDGARARTIEFAGSPFKRRYAHLINNIKAGVREHYGYAGAAFIEIIFSILSQQGGQNELKKRYKHYRNLLSAKAENEIGDRASQYFAVVWLAAELAESYLHLGGNPKEVIQTSFSEIIDEQQQDGDMATRALQEVISFAQANEKSFMGKADSNIKEFFGIWKDAEYIAIYPHKLKEFLGKAGFSYNSVLRSWSEREWIKKGIARLTYSVWYENNQYRMVVVTWSAVSHINTD